jgi:hypothetical protein
MVLLLGFLYTTNFTKDISFFLIYGEIESLEVFCVVEAFERVEMLLQKGFGSFVKFTLPTSKH